MKLKKRKHLEKGNVTTNKNRQPEMFVLPPDLLQKLGINLNSFAHPPQPSTSSAAIIETKDEINIASATIPSVDTPSDKREDTMLETASLMTTSVFLSPTFTPDLNSPLQDINHITSNNESLNPVSNYNKALCIQLNPNCISKTGSLQYGDNDQKLKEFATLISETVDYIPENNPQLQTLQEKKNSVDDHTDEAYASDLSNSNSGVSDTIGNATNTLPVCHKISNNQKAVKNIKNKIKIISEDVIQMSELRKSNELFLLNKKSLISVTPDTEISCKEEGISRYLDKEINVETKNSSNIVLSDTVVENVLQNMDVEENALDSFVNHINSDENYIIPNDETLNPENIESEKINLEDLQFIIKGVNITPASDIDTTNTVPKLEQFNQEISDDSHNFVSIINPDKIAELTSNSFASIRIAVYENTTEHEIIIPEILTEDNISSILNNDQVDNPNIETSISNCNIPFENVKMKDNLIESDAIIEKFNRNNCTYLPNYHLLNKNSDECMYNESNDLSDKQCPIANEDIDHLKRRGILSQHQTIICSEDESNTNASSENGQNVRNSSSVKDENHHCTNNSNTTEVNTKVVNEVAEYLKQFADILTKKKKLMFQTNQRKTNLSHKQVNHFTKAKECVQGIEKPGGNENKISNHSKNKLKFINKTYQRVPRTDNKTVIIENIQEIPMENNQNLCNIEYENHSTDVSINNKFCLCYDFGSLFFYDSNEPYEHLHFLDHHLHIDCGYNTLFEIYNDKNELFTEDCEVESVEEAMSTSETNFKCICWSSVYQDSNDINYLFDQNELMREVVKDNKEISTNSTEIENCILEQNKSYTIQINDDSITQVKKKQKISYRDKSIDGSKKQCGNEVCSLPASSKTLSQDPGSKLFGLHYTDIGSGPESHNIANRNKKVKYYQPCFEKSKIEPEKISQSHKVSGNSISKTIKKSEDLNPTANLSETDAKLSVQSKPAVSTPKTKYCNENSAPIASGSRTNVELKDMKHAKDVKLSIASEAISELSVSRKNYSGDFTLAKILSSTPKQKNNDKNKLASNSLGNSNMELNSTLQSKKFDMDRLSLGNLKPDVELLDLKSTIPKTKGRSEDSLEDRNKNNDSKTPSESLEEYTFATIDSADVETSTKRRSSNNLKKVSTEQSIKTDFWNKGKDKSQKETIDSTDQRMSSREIKLKRSISPNSSSHTESKVENSEIIPKKRGRKSKASIENVTSRLLKCSPKDDTKMVNMSQKSNLNNTTFDKMEETKHLKGVCEICNSTYLLEYKSQHMYKHEQIIVEEEDLNEKNKDTNVELSVPISKKRGRKCKNVTCGVCKKNVGSSEWADHVGTVHNYIAWKEGEPSFKVDDRETVLQRLGELMSQTSIFECVNCGYRRTQPRTFYAHIKMCTTTTPDDHGVAVIVNGNVKCGLCSKEVPVEKWEDHKMVDHYNVAWKVGEKPLDLNNYYSHATAIKKYKKRFRILKCRSCKLTLASPMEFYAHVLICGKTEEEKIQLKGVCEICNSTYLLVNKSQHMNIHEVKDRNKAKTEALEEKNKETHAELSIPSEAISDASDSSKISKRRRSSNNLNKVSTEDKSQNETIDSCTDQRISRREIKLNRRISSHSSSHTESKDENSEVIPKKRGRKSKASIENVTSRLLQCSPKDDTKKAKNSRISFHNNNTSDEMEAQENNKTDSTECVEFTCGVCKKNVASSEWANHVGTEHNYIAWKEGEPSFKVDDQETVLERLGELMSQTSMFQCANCRFRRKQPETFYAHIKMCTATPDDDGAAVVVNGNVTCGRCSKEVPVEKWEDHKMVDHYNVAWKVGENPLDLNNYYRHATAMKQYQKRYGKLKCRECKLTRASAMGFYAHILTCGKTEEETKHLKGVCEICNCTYLLVYKCQHMNIHEVQERNKAKKEALEEKSKETNEIKPVTGKRNAAAKALKVLGQYSNNLDFTCDKCTFATDSKFEFQLHKCTEKSADSDDDIFKVDSGDGESSESAVDSDVSDEEEAKDAKKKNFRLKVPAQKIVLPYKTNNPAKYISQGAMDFRDKNFTKNTLFPEWNYGEYECVKIEDQHNYLPKLEESCKVKISNDAKWSTIKRFEMVNDSNISCMFIGACIQSILWVPIPTESDNYLTISTHAGEDLPRIDIDRLVSGPGLIQIWNFDKFKSPPTLALGLVHDFGTVWSMDWCPSGAYDVTDDGSNHRRFGLMAVACSNGHTYILSVPHPDTLPSDNIYVKLKPVAELKFSMTSDGKDNQPTSVRWSRQKGHNTIIVGYSDGYVALFDLKTESPLLVTKEEDVTIYYPYKQERLNKGCILDVDVSPFNSELENYAHTGVTGSAARSGEVRVRCNATSYRASYLPHWPAVWTAVQEPMQAMRDILDFTGIKHHTPFARVVSSCMDCGISAVSQPPYLQTMPSHPAWDFSSNRRILAKLWMEPLTDKTSKLVSDDLSVKIEPTTYQGVIKKYGVSFKYINRCLKSVGPKDKPDILPERFPLDNVTAMSYCPNRQYHTQLAFATHSGLLFVVKT